MAKRYYNQTENRYYTEGRVMTRKIGTALWGGVPSAQQLAEWGFVEVVEPVFTPTPYVPTYEELVVQKIRLRYTVDDELALQRQRDTKPDEFAAYDAYCEACKAEARAEVEARERGER